jgi:hypothetical protein
MKLKAAAETDLRSQDTSNRLLEVVRTSLRFLSTQCYKVSLHSKVEGKSYSSYVVKAKPNLLSRPTNDALFNPDVNAVTAQWTKWIVGGHAPESLPYTLVTAYCVASDLFDRNNKKAPATYFEILVGHLFARVLGVNPVKDIALPIAGEKVKLTMDFLFDLGPSKPKVHLPVKMSTRERVVQAWAHQRLLDSAFGQNTYTGILVVHSETKLDLVTREVVEICVPDQWLAYQTLLSKMHRIYYFDIPARYAKLAEDHPVISLKHFSKFFSERDAVLS